VCDIIAVVIIILYYSRSDIGVEEAHRAGCELSLAKLQFDLAYTSVLRRAHFSTDIILEEIYGDKKSDWPEVRKCWELSERHYGALTGKNKAQMVKEYGKDQVSVCYIAALFAGFNLKYFNLVDSNLAQKL